MRKIGIIIAVILCLGLVGVAAADDDDIENQAESNFTNASEVSVGQMSVWTTAENPNLTVSSSTSYSVTFTVNGTGWYYVPEESYLTGDDYWDSDDLGFEEIEANDTEYKALYVDVERNLTITDGYDDDDDDFGPIEINESELRDYGLRNFSDTIEFDDDRIEIDLDKGEDVEVKGSEPNISEIANATFIQLSEQNTTNITIADYNQKNVTFLVENTVNNSTTFYVRQDTLLDVYNTSSLSNVELRVDGTELPYFAVSRNGEIYIAYTIDHFSTREVTFTDQNATLAATGGSGGGGVLTVFGESLGIGVIILILGGLGLGGFAIYYYMVKDD